MNEREYVQSRQGIFNYDDNIILRIPTEDDLEGLFEVATIEDPDLFENLEDDNDREWWGKTYLKLYTNPKQATFYLSIVDAITGNFVGRLAIQDCDSVAPEIGIVIIHNYQGLGIAARAIDLYIRKAFSLRKIPYFTARIDKNNINSQKMISKLNSEEKMIIRDAYCYCIKQGNE